MEKFDIEEHEKRMRELLEPKPQVGGDLLTRFREMADKRAVVPPLPPVNNKEI